jgi:hypothetical protein
MFRPMSSQKNARLIAEAVTAGLAFGSVLCWAGTCLVSTFRPQDLPDPYWDGIPWLRTDTSGFGAFNVATVSLAISEYLRLWRRQHAGDRSATTSYAASGTAALMTRSLLFCFSGDRTPRGRLGRHLLGHLESGVIGKLRGAFSRQMIFFDELLCRYSMLPDDLRGCPRVCLDVPLSQVCPTQICRVNLIPAWVL